MHSPITAARDSASRNSRRSAGGGSVGYALGRVMRQADHDERSAWSSQRTHAGSPSTPLSPGLVTLYSFDPTATSISR